MSLFAQGRRAVKEVALVTTADIEDELKAVRKMNNLSESARYITAQQAVYKDKLTGFKLCLLTYVFIYLYLFVREC